MEASFERLHRLEATTEFLLISDGDRIDYYVGTESAEIDRLERIFRGCFPNDYEFARADPEFDTVLNRRDDVATVEFTG